MTCGIGSTQHMIIRPISRLASDRVMGPCSNCSHMETKKKKLTVSAEVDFQRFLAISAWPSDFNPTGACRTGLYMWPYA